MKIGACYIRVSTDDQTEFSPDAQLKKIKEYAKKNDIVLYPEYIYMENGISGRSVEKRIEFKKMIATAKMKPKPFEVVLIHAYDRFARNVKESRIYKELLRDDLGIELISITEDFGNDKNSFLMEGIKDILNEYYSLNLRDEVLKGMTEKASRGGVQTMAPFGYKVENNIYVPIKEEADIVKFIFEQFSNYKMNLTELANHLNNLGIKTKFGNKFGKRAVKYILGNPVYKGYIRWSKKGAIDYVVTDYMNEDIIVKKGKHESIISEEIFEKAQERLKANLPENKPRARSNDIWHWSKGLIRCSYCGCTYIKQKGGKFLRCNGYNRAKCDNKKLIYVTDLEKIILEQLKHDYKSDIAINLKPKEKTNINECEIYKKRLEALKTSETRIKEAYMLGIDTLEEYKENKSKIQNDIKKVEKEIKKYSDTAINKQDEIKDEIKKVYNIIKDKNKNMETKHLLIHTLINEIIYNPDNDTLALYYY